MDLTKVYSTTELDLANALFRGAELLLFVPDATVEGEHWTMDVTGIQQQGDRYLVTTSRGVVTVRTRG